MAVHQIDTLLFLVEYPGLPRAAGAAQAVSDGAFGADQRRRLFESMESTPAAQWVRERRLGVRFSPTEPHQGRYVFRMTFALEEEAALFAAAWLPAEPGAARVAA
ncbi:hypothetical protein E2493_06305 [Sphingomonas parva]|uniref:Uncharacterized protein n=1 Tax=Sphingomonas parva TaxID=2555898 RepID=A0A4Y8ZT94_9SPHN|nr:hypothetical protein [Sphingomonas parva]TFI59134.1 hypothetical protein E2493_06305 [Sphingomonas parva]